jgi:riboflavin transporter FmnP
MENSRKSMLKLTGAAALAPITVLFQVSPPIFLTPWFMRLDFAAVPWIVCWMLFGFKASLLCMVISAPLIGFLGPFAGGWVGALMKISASIWMVAIPALFTLKTKNSINLLKNKHLFILTSLIAILTRDLATVFLNLYFAIPVFFGMSSTQVLEFFTNPRFQSFISHFLGLTWFSAYFVEVVFWNTIQGLIDLYTSLIIGLIVLKRFKFLI